MSGQIVNKQDKNNIYNEEIKDLNKRYAQLGTNFKFNLYNYQWRKLVIHVIRNI